MGRGLRATRNTKDGGGIYCVGIGRPSAEDNLGMPVHFSKEPSESDSP